MWKLLFLVIIVVFAGVMVVNSLLYKIEHKPKKFDVDAKAVGVELKLMTVETSSGSAEPSTISNLAAYIRNNKLDIVAIQDENGIDAVADELLKSSYPMFKSKTSNPGLKHLAILSKYPIVETSQNLYETTAIVQRAKIMTSEGAIDVFNTLLPSGVPGAGCDSLKNVQTYINTFSSDSIVMGNFNMDLNEDYVKVGCPAVADLTNRFQYSCAGLGSCTGSSSTENGTIKNEVHSWILTSKNSGLRLVESQTVTSSDTNFSFSRPLFGRIVLKK